MTSGIYAKGDTTGGDEHKRQWFAELDILQSELERERPFGKCLELACGTGLWTACNWRAAPPA